MNEITKPYINVAKTKRNSQTHQTDILLTLNLCLYPKQMSPLIGVNCVARQHAASLCVNHHHTIRFKFFVFSPLVYIIFYFEMRKKQHNTKSLYTIRHISFRVVVGVPTQSHRLDSVMTKSRRK